MVNESASDKMIRELREEILALRAGGAVGGGGGGDAGAGGAGDSKANEEL